MEYNVYIDGLMALRRELDTKIDNEIENVMRGRGDSKRLKETLEYSIDTNNVLKGAYKEDETK